MGLDKTDIDPVLASMQLITRLIPMGMQIASVANDYGAVPETAGRVF